MEIADSGEFTRRLIAIAELFDVDLSPAKQALYFQALRDVPFPDVASALSASVKACTFMPKPAELRKLAIGDIEDLAEGAWLLFRQAMTRVGAYASIATADPALGETILAMFQSWPAACSSELSPEMWASKRKEFGRIYRVLADRQLAGARYLPGLTESQNSGRREWERFTPVAYLEQTACHLLPPAEADVLRQQLSAGQPPTMASLKQLAASAVKTLPSAQETA